MSTHRKSQRSILRRQAIGFLLMIVCIWLVEILHIPHLLYGVPAEIDPMRVFVRTMVVVAIWGWVHFTTRRLLRRLHELEEFLRVCSWCRKVDRRGEWLTMEQYFGSQLATATTHGICPECMKVLTTRPTVSRVSAPPMEAVPAKAQSPQAGL
jgi:hypothetical protein